MNIGKVFEKYRKELVPKYDYFIEPDEPIETPEEMIEEIRKYFKDKEVSVIKEEPLPIVSIDGEVYIARTDRFVGLNGGGRKIDTPHPVKYYGGGIYNPLGFKFIYLYRYDANE